MNVFVIIFVIFIVYKMYDAMITPHKPKLKLRWCDCCGRTISGTYFYDGKVFGTNDIEYIDSRNFAKQYMITHQFDNQYVAERCLHGYNGVYLGTLDECKKWCEEDWWKLITSFERGNNV